MGVENAGQLILQLWLLGPFVKEIINWTGKEAAGHLWTGLGHIITFTVLDASFLEKMIAKFLVSSVIICAGKEIMIT